MSIVKARIAMSTLHVGHAISAVILAFIAAEKLGGHVEKAE
jgi:hypothetical protein